jgi:predicted regulator of Ras-like GTPase activity (Roadblock/LC7/MglB family)
MSAPATAPSPPPVSQLATPFGAILRRAVDAVPGAIGGAFADRDGELVDAVATGDPLDLAIMTAHYGVLIRHINGAFGTWHVGSPEYIVIQHADVDILIHVVADGYYALLAIATPTPLARALAAIRQAAADLRLELA